MLDIFAILKDRLFKSRTGRIDNHVFKLHYQITVLLLVAFSLMVTSRQYIGNPITCIAPTPLIKDSLIEDYCWISTTYTLPRGMDKAVGVEVPHPGIIHGVPDEERTYHQYYQWVCFVLFLQAIMFYVPHYLWKIWENGRVMALSMGLDVPILTDNQYQERKDLIVDYFRKNLRGHSMYLGYYLFCEALNFINVIGQMYLTDKFLGGAFLTYGLDVAAFSEQNQEARTDPMVRVFPRVTKCTFHNFGPSGDVQKYDALCVLSINVINEKIYIFLWFWFVVLAILSGLAIGYRLATIASRQFRLFLLRAKFHMSHANLLDTINRKLGPADWFLLQKLGSSVESATFRQIVIDLANSLECDYGNSNTMPLTKQSSKV